MPKTRISMIEKLGLSETIKNMFLGGKSFSEIGRELASRGITEGMVAGYIYRNQIKRHASSQIATTIQETPVPAPKIEMAIEPPAHVIARPEITIPRISRRFNVMSWAGLKLAGPVTADDIIKHYVTYLSAEEFHNRFEREGELTTTRVLISLDDS